MTSPTPWRARTWQFVLAALTLATFLLHGYHPLAEDGGLYVAGVEWLLNPRLFPHYTGFVSEHLRYSLFAPTLATAVRITQLPLTAVLFAADIATIWLSFVAARQLLRRCLRNDAAQLAGLALLAAWWTLPIAGTSLTLSDPYVTARSFAFPFAIFATAFAMDDWLDSPLSAILCTLALIVAAAFHPLLAACALALVTIQRTLKSTHSRLRLALLTAAAITAAALLQQTASPESPAFVAAAISRYYWFLSQWHWYELVGLVAPMALFTALERQRRVPLAPAARTLLQACIMSSVLGVVIAALFAREDLATHLVARLQPLRIFGLAYAVLALLLGATFARLCVHSSNRLVRALPTATLLTIAVITCLVQRKTFPDSPHLELPGRMNPNPWAQAFVWARNNTPVDALFALDALYVNTPGEDAQTFRATALRSALPDFSKDGGEASLMPTLAPQWQLAARAQQDLAAQPEALRDQQLRTLGATWMIVASNTPTTHLCPYDNGAIKVCRL